MRAYSACIVFFVANVGFGLAQGPVPTNNVAQQHSPYLFVRFLPPQGWTAILPRGSGKSPHPTSAVLGLRPGYAYRGQLTRDKANAPELFPTIEVIGSALMPPDFRPERHVAAITWSDEELSQALAGRMITKILYIEDPDLAQPQASVPNSPLVTVAEPGQDIIRLALRKGRPVARVSVGSRLVEEGELERAAIPGTVWQVGAEAPERPSIAPYLPLCPPPCDPVTGACKPDLEIVRDGGDRAPRAAIGGQSEAVGVDTEDSVAEFTNSKGARRVIPSNRVCLYMPRFCWVSQQIGLGTVDHQTGPAGAVSTSGPDRLDHRVPSLATVAETRINGVRGRLRPGGIGLTQYAGRVVKLQILQGQELVQAPLQNLVERGADAVTDRQRPQSTVQQERLLVKTGGISLHELMAETKSVALSRIENGPQVISTEATLREVLSDCKEDMVILSHPMVLHKTADKQVALPGDVVTFTLRFANMTGKALRDVAIVDNLSPRLEYVEGSSRSSKETVFTVQENEAGSLILRWEAGTLAAGESAVVRFQAKVR